MILCDAHVHIYDRFDLNLFFSAAFQNFSREAATLKLVDFTAVIFLADWSNINWFDRLAQMCTDEASQIKADTNRSFFVSKTSDQAALQVYKNKNQSLYVIAGKKIITSENLEVLALCSTDQFHDGQSLRDTVNSINRSNAIPVIPWAVGKWTGSRGKVLDDLMDQPEEAKFYLCDNGNRPSFWGWPRHFQKAQRLKIPLLSGSDPLHFSEEANRAGGFGFTIDAPLREQFPASDLLSTLQCFSIRPNLYGRLESPWRFLKNQIRMQIFKKKWRKELLK